MAELGFGERGHDYRNYMKHPLQHYERGLHACCGIRALCKSVLVSSQSRQNREIRTFCLPTEGKSG